MTVLTIERIGHRFGRRVLFRSVTLSVSGGEMLAVIGPNGAGKSTLLKILGGLLRPVAGTVTLSVQGRTLSREQIPFQVGFMAPYVGVYEDLTAHENLQFVASVRGMSRSEDRIREVLEAVQISSRARERVRTYSSGMKQRLRIAIAVLADPPVLLFDEPTVNLDAPGRALCAGILADARKRGRVVVVASNVMEDYQGANQVLCVSDYR